MGKRVRLTERHVLVAISHYNPDPGHPTPRRWEKIAPPLPPKERGGEVGEPRNLFPRLGVGVIFCTWGRLEPALGGNRRRGRGYRLVSSSRRDQCLALVHFNPAARMLSSKDRHT